MTIKELIQLAIDCGLCDKDLSDVDDEYAMTDYGNATTALVAFYEAIKREVLHVKE